MKVNDTMDTEPTQGPHLQNSRIAPPLLTLPNMLSFKALNEKVAIIKQARLVLK